MLGLLCETFFAVVMSRTAVPWDAGSHRVAIFAFISFTGVFLKLKDSPALKVVCQILDILAIYCALLWAMLFLDLFIYTMITTGYRGPDVAKGS
jgi:hypothetical protein